MKTALLVIDYINGIMNGSCKEYASKHPILQNTNTLIAGCKKADIPIYFVRLAFDEKYSNIPKHSNMFKYVRDNNLFQLGNSDAEFVSELDINPDDKIINKTVASPFHSEGLKEALKAEGIEKLIFAGVATDNAIDIGVREAHDMGFYTVIAEDACGASSEDFHKWTITMLKKIANEILCVDEILTALKS